MTYQLYSFSQLDTGLLYEVLAHRQEVFLLEQRNIYPDLDGWDQKAMHLLARDGDGFLAGYVRLLPAGCGYEESGLPTFGRLAVKRAARKRGLGGELARRACDWLLADSGGKVVEISAMAYLEGFYSALGFVRRSEEFQISGVPHITMRWQRL